MNSLKLISRLVIFPIFLFLYIFCNYSYAQTTCNPENHIYDSCPEQNPDYNPSLRDYVNVNQSPEYYHEDHPIDPLLPNFANLFEGYQQPTISGTYAITPIENFDSPQSWSEVNAVGFALPSGTNVLVPPSGYQINEQGYQATVLYAGSDGITINYTADGNIAGGYTISLKNITVNPEIIKQFQTAQSQGLLVALDAFQNLGTTNGSEVIMFLRDTGAILDPRWLEWWANFIDPNDPLAMQLIKKMLAMRSNTCKVGNSIPNPAIFRPKPCQNCSLNVPKPTNTCAQSPIIVQYETFGCNYPRAEGCSDNLAAFDWEDITFNLNTKETKLPFVGYKEICRSSEDQLLADSKSCITDTTNRSSNPNDYLNDYWEGTALFDKREFDMSNPTDTRDIYWEYGVYRKLAPQEIQDSHRKDMIKRGFNYKIEGTSHTMQEWGGVHFTSFSGDPNKGRIPPVLDTKDCTTAVCVQQKEIEYQDNLNKWLKTDWGKYWYHIPLFSREDAPGKVTVTIEHPPGEIDDSVSTSYPLSIPHLTRLYESTTALYNLLTPTMQQNLAATKLDNVSQVSYNPQKTPILLAQAGVSDSREPKLLAQSGDYSFEYGATIDPNGNYTFTMISNNGTTGDVAVDLVVNGNKVGMIFGRSNIGNSPVTITGSFEPDNAHSISFTVTYNGQNPPGCDGNHCYVSCVKTGSTFTCDKTGPPPPPPPDPCKNHSNIDASCNRDNPVSDQRPNDEICCSSNSTIKVDGYKEFVSDDLKNTLCNPRCYEELIEGEGGAYKETKTVCDSPTATAKMTRTLSVKLDIPYLKDVFEKSAGPKMSIFNLFKPAQFPDYPDDQALSNMTYEIMSSDPETYIGYYQDAIDNIQSKSFTGELYYPYLGGIQQAKKCVSEQVLVPVELQAAYNQCQFWGGDLLNARASQTATCTEIPKDLPFLGRSTVDKETLRNVGSQRFGEKNGVNAKNSYLANFDQVYDSAVSSGWNPVFVIALWIEESAASSVTAWDLGCIYDKNATPLPKNNPLEENPTEEEIKEFKSNLAKQLTCLSGKTDYPNPDGYSDYKNFMLHYSGESGNGGKFCNNSGFPIKIDRWYTVLTTNVPYNSLQ